MSRIRDIANILTASTSIATDAEVTAAMSAHNTAANGHVGRGTTENRPASPTIGDVYFDTTLASLIAYKSTGWEKISQDPAPQIASISPTTAATTGTTITITGSSFKSGVSVQFIGTNSISYNSPVATFVGAGTVTATTPALSVANEPYDVKVINNDNQFAILENALDAGGNPTWNTASGTLATINEQSSLSTSVSATDPDGTSIVYSSSNLPGWISLNSSTGALTGTSPNIESNTTYNFDITASDGVNTSSRSFNVVVNYVIPSVSVDYLVVAGGGGGGRADSGNLRAGGRGGGGLRSTVTATGRGGSLETPLQLQIGTTYTIIVGTGGIGSVSKTQLASVGNGGNSSISGAGITTVTSIGGGGGGQGAQDDNSYLAGASGGSGGGGAGSAGTTQTTANAAGTIGQGYDGGAGQHVPGSWASGGGGGGAGSPGGNGSNGVGGSGGNGVAVSITGSSVTYAGGGAGGTHNNLTGTPGSGTGSGVPGGGGNCGGSVGFNGNSGTVILRATVSAASTTGSPSYTTSGSYHIYQFNGNGSITF